MLGSKHGESFSLAPVSADNQLAATVRGEGPQRNAHTPPLYSPNATAIARNEHDH